MRCAAILVAAGAGARMGAGVPKAFMPVLGRPLMAWSQDVLLAGPDLEALVVVVPPGMEAEALQVMGPGQVDVAVVSGGESRSHSVALGLEAVPPGVEVVLVHDAARPLLDRRLVRAVLDGIGDADGAIAAAPLADTPKRVDDDGEITDSPGREGLWLAQTPQAFRVEVLREAVQHAAAMGRLHDATDCASLVQGVGGRVRVVANASPNLKVTTPADVRIAELLLAERDGGAGVR